MRIVQIEGKAEMKCFRASGGNWVAVCDPLGLTIQSDTFAHLMEDMAEALNAILRDLLAAGPGEYQRFLWDRGWRPQGAIPEPGADVWFDLPFDTRTAHRDSEALLR